MFGEINIKNTGHAIKVPLVFQSAAIMSWMEKNIKIFSLYNTRWQYCNFLGLQIAVWSVTNIYLSHQWPSTPKPLASNDCSPERKIYLLSAPHSLKLLDHKRQDLIFLSSGGILQSSILKYLDVRTSLHP